MAAVAAAAAPVIVLDNSAASIQGGLRCEGGGYAGGFHHNGAITTASEFAAWDFNVNKSGCYLIEEHHPSASCTGQALEDRVPVRISYCKGQTGWVGVNQSEGGGRWNRVGLLPFSVDWPGRIAISGAGLPHSACPGGGCLWVADAFRLTYVAQTCHEAEAQTMSPTPREQVEAELSSTAAPAAAPALAPPSSDASFVVQATLDEPDMEGKKATFKFRVPLDGCYVMEEYHPRMPGVLAPIKVGYCKGLSASGLIDLGAGRHLRWNYLASLPFFDDRDGHVALPRALMDRIRRRGGRPRHHQFRLTRVGSTCRAPESQVYRVLLDVQANLSRAPGGLADLSSRLELTLARAAGVEPSRLSLLVTSAAHGKVGVTLMPPATSRMPTGSFGTPVASPEAALALVGAAKNGTLDREVCGLAGAPSGDCGVTVVAAGPAMPQVTRRKGRAPPKVRRGGGKKEGGMPFHVLVGIIAGGLAAAAVLLAAGGHLCLRARSRRSAKLGQKDVENPPELEKESAAQKAPPASTESAGGEHGEKQPADTELAEVETEEGDGVLAADADAEGDPANNALADDEAEDGAEEQEACDCPSEIAVGDEEAPAQPAALTDEARRAEKLSFALRRV